LLQTETRQGEIAMPRLVHIAREVLDPFHALEHVAAAAKGLYGEGAAEAADWATRVRRSLLGDGRPKNPSGPAESRGLQL
jgi:hypothetical protein